VSRSTLRTLLAAAVAAMLVYCATHLKLGTDITNFMPEGGRNELAALSRRLANSELMRSMALCIGAADPHDAVAVAQALCDELRNHPEIAWIRSGPDTSGFEELYELYFPRRHYFLSDRPERDIPLLTSDAGLRRRAAQAQRELRLPTATLLKGTLARDPLAAFPALLERLRADQPDLESLDGTFLTPDHRFAVVLLGTRHSSFASGPQSRFLADLDRAFAAATARTGVAATLEKSGANRIAVRAEQRIKRDVYLIAACSFVGVAVLFLTFLRSLRSFALSVLPAVVGILFATTSGLIVLGHFDGLTMAFGASLIGVAIDYSIHVLNHHALATDKNAAETVARLRPSLVLGAVTTMASFAGLLLTSSPGFREMGFFSIAGLAAALFVTLYVLPAFLGGAGPVPAVSRRVADGLGNAVRALRGRRTLLAVFCLALLLPALAAVPRLRWVDDLSRLGDIDADLIAEETRVRERVSHFDTGRFVITMAADTDTAVARNDEVHRRLSALVDAGELSGMRSLHQLLWSPDLQRRNWEVLQAQPDLYPRLDAAFHDAGFRRGAFAPFASELAAEPPPPLRLADLRATPLGPLLSTTAFALGEQTAVVTYLRGVRNPAALHDAVASLDDTLVFEQRAFVNQIYGEFRATTLRQILVGSVLVVVVLLARYRAWRPSLAAFLPSLMVVVALLGAFALFRVETNLLHVMGLMMVMGMGVDYGVFLVDTVDQPRAFASTMLSLLLSCLTTVFVFGTLALSDHPALRAIGVTTGAGVLLAFVFAPVSLLLLEAPPQAEEPAA
jgi:predicted exporter